MHLLCLQNWLCTRQASPVYIKCMRCLKHYGPILGTGPLNSYMTSMLSSTSLHGYPGVGTIVIKYQVEEGLQSVEHPNPGTPYLIKKFPRLAFLPDTDRGRKLLSLLNTAFKRRLTFEIGQSTTHEEENCVIWGNIPHKTEAEGLYGYPNPNYLDRLEEILKQYGITEVIY